MLDEIGTWLHNNGIVKLPTKHMKLIEQLDALGAHVNRKYEYLNNGGCCVFAAIVARELHNRGIPVGGIVASYSGAANIDEIRPLIKKNIHSEWDDNGISFSHVGVEFKVGRAVKHYDSNGVHGKAKKLDKMVIYKGRMTVQELEALARKPDGWNDMYDRKNTPGLRRMVKQYLKDIPVTV